ncbi:MAG: hypothetical protein H0T15_01380 [Thermoleophilaceae bacterium]|nr:hypothetical protein [Thermoleophilaceae bacterium]
MKKLLILPVLMLAACGGGSGDTLALDVKSPFGPDRAIRVSGDGRASCDEGGLQAMESEEVIRAREIEREAKPFAVAARTFGSPAPSRRFYTLRTTDGTVRWTEGGRGLPPVLAKMALLGIELERRLCR